MTGFASKTFILMSPSGERSTISMNLKTLNSRFFETSIKLPQILSPLETICIKQCKENFRRGYIHFTVYVSNPNIFQGSIIPAIKTIDSYINAIEQIKDKYNIEQKLSLENILRLPNIFSQEEQQLDETFKEQIIQNLQELIDTALNERLIEGNALVIDIQKRMMIIKREMEIITQRAQEFVEEYKKKVHAALQEISADDNLLANAQKSSLYGMLDKIDIHEEITRFNNHIEQFNNHIFSEEMEKGKRFDFILQELGREINTITAKCSDANISNHAINIKVEVEKIREQIQNIV